MASTENCNIIGHTLILLHFSVFVNTKGGDKLRKIPLTEYGKFVKKSLIEKDKSQEWLINEVAKKTGMYVDSSVLNKILTGRTNSENLISAINEILTREENTQCRDVM